MQCGNDAARVVDAQGRLRHIGDRRVGRNVERIDIGFGLHQGHGIGNLAHCAFDLRMSGMTDENEPAPLRHIALALIVHLGDQRTGRVQDGKLPRSRLLLDAFGHAVGTEDGDRVRRDLGQILDKMRAFCLEALDDMLVVDDFMADIDRRPVLLQGTLDNFNGSDDASAKTTRLSQYDLHQ
jgi:hypothetical protein